MISDMSIKLRGLLSVNVFFLCSVALLAKLRHALPNGHFLNLMYDTIGIQKFKSFQKM